MSSEIIEERLRPVVLVSRPNVPEIAIELLKIKCDVVVVKSFPPKPEVLEKCRGVDGILWGSYQSLDVEILDAAGTNLKAISTMSSGFDQIDVEEVRSRKIQVGYAPGIASETVAEFAVGLLIAAIRRFHEARKAIENGKWENFRLQWMLGFEIRGSTVGFFGFGRIAQAILHRLVGFDVSKFIYHTRSRNSREKSLNATLVSFDQLLFESDIIIVACPLTDETKMKFNSEAFSKMKSNCVFINISRGKIVDPKALYEALKSKKIFAAGLDVTMPEPLPANDPLLQLPNCVITPHMGSATKQNWNNMAAIAAHNILRALDGRQMVYPIEAETSQTMSN